MATHRFNGIKINRWYLLEDGCRAWVNYVLPAHLFKDKSLPTCYSCLVEREPGVGMEMLRYYEGPRGQLSLDFVDVKYLITRFFDAKGVFEDQFGKRL